MSATLSGSSSSAGARVKKSTCRQCNRTVLLVEIGGVPVAADPELINVIPFAGAAGVKYLARRVHGDLCLSYRLEAERAEAKRRLRGDSGGQPGAGAPGRRRK